MNLTCESLARQLPSHCLLEGNQRHVNGDKCPHAAQVLISAEGHGLNREVLRNVDSLSASDPDQPVSVSIASAVASMTWSRGGYPMLGKTRVGRGQTRSRKTGAARIARTTPPPRPAAAPMPARRSAAQPPKPPESADVMSAESIEAVMPLEPAPAPPHRREHSTEPQRPLPNVGRRRARPVKAQANTAKRTPRRANARQLEGSRRDRVQLELLLEKGVGAMLTRDLKQAWSLLSEAARLDPGHPLVQANLSRLRDLGFGSAASGAGPRKK